MKIYIDGFGFVADSITRKIVFNHNVNKDDILVNTYDANDNSDYIRFLDDENIKYSFSSYKEKKTIHDIESFNPDCILSLYGRRILPKKRSVRSRKTGRHGGRRSATITNTRVKRKCRLSFLIRALRSTGRTL